MPGTGTLCTQHTEPTFLVAVLASCLEPDNPEDYVIQVSQWEAYVFDDKTTPEDRRSRCYTFHSAHFSEDAKVENASASIDTMDQRASQRGRSDSISSMEEEPRLAVRDLWETDRTSQDVTREGYIITPDAAGYGGHNVTEGYGVEHEGRGHNRRASFDASLLSTHSPECFVIKERLHGYVRTTPHISKLPPLLDAARKANCS